MRATAILLAAVGFATPFLAAIALGRGRLLPPPRRRAPFLALAIFASLIAYVPADEKPGPGPGPEPPAPTLYNPVLRFIRGADRLFHILDRLHKDTQPTTTPILTR